MIQKVTEVSVSLRKREPAGLCGLRKQVTEANEGPLECRRKKARIYTHGEGEGESPGHAPGREYT